MAAMRAADEALLGKKWSYLDRFVTALFLEALEEEDDQMCSTPPSRPPAAVRKSLEPALPVVSEGESTSRATGKHVKAGRKDAFLVSSSSRKLPQPERQPAATPTPKSKSYGRSESALSDASTVSFSPSLTKPRMYVRSETDLSEAATVHESTTSSSNLLLFDSDDEEEQCSSTERHTIDPAELFADVSSVRSEAVTEVEEQQPLDITTVDADEDDAAGQLLRQTPKYEDGVWGAVSLRPLGDRLLPAASPPHLPLPPCHFELLSAPSRGGGARAKRHKVVLLHGWMQEHGSWLPTARALAARGTHDVLLLDFYNHGRSPPLLPPHVLCKDTLVAQVRSVVRRVGWEEERLCIGGCSLGGAVACNYALRFPAHVAALVLVAAAGLNEPWWSGVYLLGWFQNLLTLLTSLLALLAAPLLCLLTGECEEEAGCVRGRSVEGLRRSKARQKGGSGVVVKGLGAVWWAASHMRLIWDTPQFGVPSDMPLRLKELNIQLALAWGSLDPLHTPQLERWGAGRAVPHVTLPLDHATFCTHFHTLNLDQRASWWTPPPLPTG